MVTFTDRAREILGRADAAARRLNPDAHVRLAEAPGGGIEAQLASEPGPADHVVEVGGATVFVQARLDGVVDVEDPHDRLVLRPS